MSRPSKKGSPADLRGVYVELSDAYDVGADCVDQLRAVLAAIHKIAQISGDRVTERLAKVGVNLADGFHNDLRANFESANSALNDLQEDGQ
ncbi:hypothetical protein [Herbaspirillum frisingense]|uniref:hypothetical protein n=1 Tax=Herbaspirillum frisingense TaxID=92645 RepID=UPI001F17B39B|nr:hypothetical protein [Herbaspirillum frisingense]UIN23507.1 hypothetical protein LAZ82_10595 [Herbaspirillum frisingense]